MTTTTPPPIPESDEALLAECRIETFRSGGKGGQHQNTTDSGVRLVHLPSGVRAEGRSHRSQLRNRELALEILRRKLKARAHRPKKRRATRVPNSQKRKRRDAKKRVSDKKRLRKPPKADSDR